MGRRKIEIQPITVRTCVLLCEPSCSHVVDDREREGFWFASLHSVLTFLFASCSTSVTGL